MRLTKQDIQYPADRARPELLEPTNGEHVWITVVAHRMSTEAVRRAHAGGQVLLDMENIASVHTGCYVCEEPYSDRLSYRKCPGEPDA